MSGVVVNYVIPSIGSVLCLMLYSSPLKEVYAIHKKQDLGPFNPTPYALQILNAVAWCTYGMYQPLPTAGYVFYPNWYGVITGVVILGVTYPLSPKKTQVKIMGILITLASLYYFIAFTLHIAVEDLAVKQTVLGSIAICVQLCFFASPLETLATVIKTKDSKSIYWPLSLITLIAASFSVTYGLAIKNTVIAVPNVFTAILAAIQLMICMIYQPKPLLKNLPEPEIVDGHAFDTVIQIEDIPSSLRESA
jgi:solute carrier family 50 protein (sugar transporter)